MTKRTTTATAAAARSQSQQGPDEDTNQLREQSFGRTVYQLPAASPGNECNTSLKQITTLVIGAPFYVLFAVIQTLLRWFSPNRQEQFQACFMIPLLCNPMTKAFHPHRQALLAGHIKPTDVVLDVGSGFGPYFPYLSKAARVVALEPVSAFHQALEQSAQQAGISPDRLQIVAQTLEEYEASLSGKEKFDWIIVGNVLCETRNLRAALGALNRLLKDPSSSHATDDNKNDTDDDDHHGGGTLFFMEHIGEKKGTLVRLLQDVLDPFWCHATGGCNFNRDTMDLMQEYQPNWDFVYWEYDFSALHWVIGLARKKTRSRVLASGTRKSQIG